MKRGRRFLPSPTGRGAGGEGRFGPTLRVSPHPSPLPEGEGAGFSGQWHMRLRRTRDDENRGRLFSPLPPGEGPGVGQIRTHPARLPSPRPSPGGRGSQRSPIFRAVSHEAGASPTTTILPQQDAAPPPVPQHKEGRSKSLRRSQPASRPGLPVQDTANRRRRRGGFSTSSECNGVWDTLHAPRPPGPGAAGLRKLGGGYHVAADLAASGRLVVILMRNRRA